MDDGRNVAFFQTLLTTKCRLYCANVDPPIFGVDLISVFKSNVPLYLNFFLDALENFPGSLGANHNYI